MAESFLADVSKKNRPIVLIVLDGWGIVHAERKKIGLAESAPNMGFLWKNYPKTILRAFKHPVGVDRKIQTSEIGHASLGSGRTVLQDLTEISLAIEGGVFFENPTLKKNFEVAKRENKAVHLVGVLSDGGVNGDVAHAQALLKFAAREGVKKVYIHLITDGFDIEDKTAPNLLGELEQTMRIAGIGEIATIGGRYWGLDRNNNWDRTKVFYEAMVLGKGEKSKDPRQAILESYSNGITDEKIRPTIIESKNNISSRVNEGDIVISWNFRPDRSQQLVRAFLDKNVFTTMGLTRNVPLSSVRFITLTDYHLNLPGLEIAFPSAVLENTLSELLANHGLTQLKIAESEKYAHVTYFFNGGREAPFDGEDRIIVPSKKTDSFAKNPEMRSKEITELLETNILSGKYDFIFANYANVDLVGHSLDDDALKKAVSFVDESVRRIVNSIIKTDGVLIITADHGSIEHARRFNLGIRQIPEIIDPIPFIQVSAKNKKSQESVLADLEQLLPEAIKTRNRLQDVAPTILELIGIAKPSDMEGLSLLRELN